MSGLGKGVCAAALAKLLSFCGLAVTCVKMDPYLNVDAGTMNPIIHGEVFVTDDGGETDMDIGTYERYLDNNLTAEHNITTGEIYRTVIDEERKGDYLGRCVQIIPHITNEIKKRIRQVVVKSGSEIALVECGGTVGDIESLPFLEALRQIKVEEGESNCVFLHVTLAPELDSVGEQKTKPTQHSIQELRRIGIQPDIIVVRCKNPLLKEVKEKISLFTNVNVENVISNKDAKSTYEVPEILADEGIVDSILKQFQIDQKTIQWKGWKDVAITFNETKEAIRIAMVGKYVSLADSYASVNQALKHSAAKLGYRVEVDWIDSEEIEKSPKKIERLGNYDGILIPGGFGSRGIEGKIIAADFARKSGTPFLGICLGFQLSVVSFARNVCKLEGAHSTELNPSTTYPVIDLLPEQKTVKDMGATMRLGGHDINVREESLAFKTYGSNKIRQRHRHRYELNQTYRYLFEKKAMKFSGWSDNGRRIEILELGFLVYLELPLNQCVNLR